MSQVSMEFLKNHLKVLCRFRDPFENPENLAEVQRYIRRAFQSFGYEIFEDVFRCEGREFSNTIAMKPGQKEIPDLIIAAHFDAVPGSPGADDNASGVAALLETARLAFSSSRNVHFIAFNLEEYGMRGSQAYLEKRKKQLKQAKQKNQFCGMLSLEMVGYTCREKGSQKMPVLLKPFYPDAGTFLALVGESGSKTLLQEAKKAFQSNGLTAETLSVPLKGNLFPEVRLSDHSPFWDEGLPALLVTDTSFFRNPHYHLPSDTPETLDLEFLKRVTEGVLRLVLSP